MQYSKEENLKEAVWKQYKDKPYFHEFERIYKRKLIKARAKRLAKRILDRT